MLIAEGAGSVREVIAQILLHTGYAVQKADHAAQVLPLVETFQPDIILLDLSLPGGEVASLLQTLCGRQPRPRLFALSGGDPEETLVYRAAHRLLGASHVLLKPFDAVALLTALNAQT